jgi:hypothetical protein
MSAKSVGHIFLCIVSRYKGAKDNPLNLPAFLLNRGIRRRKDMWMRRALSVAFGLILACAAFLPAAHADEWNQKTELSFNRPVALPHVTLPAGTYWFILANGPANRNVVEVFSKHWNHEYATLVTVPTIRPTSTSHTQLTFAERPSAEPQALLKWYYPGRVTGHEFLFSPIREKRFSKDPKVNELAPHLKVRS